MAQAQMNAERNPDSEMAPSVSSIKKNYPGGRDDSNLTVQPFKRITKKESENRSVDPEEEDYDQGNASSGFGE